MQQASQLGGGVRDEMRREQHRRDQEELERQQRMSALQSTRTRPKAAAAAPVALETVARADTAATVKLDTAEKARQAMLYYEIFSAPKALRKGSELWEL